MAMARRLVSILLLLLAVSCSAQKVVRLGFLVPYPDGDSSVPKRLADEWISAIRVAMEVLGPKYSSSFTVEPFVQNSACDRTVAAQAAQRLVDSQVVGVVGPACSEAVVGANSVLKPAGIPFVSFAATADGFAGEDYSTFFRTVYADRHQAAALGDVIQFFKFNKVRIFYTNEVYGQGLAQYLKDLLLAAQPPLVPDMVEVDYPATNSPAEYEKYFSDHEVNATSISVFATLPIAAENLWKAAFNLNLTRFPWWYLGSDGAVAFDLIGEGDSLNHLTHALQGELGVGPFRGNYNPHSSPLPEFLSFWSSKSHAEYPGLVTLATTPKLTEPRMYVTYLFDAVWSFYEAFLNILAVQGKDVTKDLVLSCFRDEPANCVNFDGTTGTVAFNLTSGERRMEVQTAEYSLYNLIDYNWKEKSKWVLGSYNINPNLDFVLRPGPLPANWREQIIQQAPAAVIPDGLDNPAPIDPSFDDFTPTSSSSSSSSGGGGGGPSGGAIAALVIVLLVAVAGLSYGGWYWYKKRQEQNMDHTQFVRML